MWWRQSWFDNRHLCPADTLHLPDLPPSLLFTQTHVYTNWITPLPLPPPSSPHYIRSCPSSSNRFPVPVIQSEAADHGKKLWAKLRCDCEDESCTMALKAVEYDALCVYRESCYNQADVELFKWQKEPTFVLIFSMLTYKTKSQLTVAFKTAQF